MTLFSKSLDLNLTENSDDEPIIENKINLKLDHQFFTDTNNFQKRKNSKEFETQPT